MSLGFFQDQIAGINRNPSPENSFKLKMLPAPVVGRSLAAANFAQASVG